MAEKPSTTTSAAVAGQHSLLKDVQHLIMLSIGLNFQEKDELIKKLPGLSQTQLERLKVVFEEENKKKEAMLGDFFSKHPQLYAEFERFSKDHVSSIYRDVESGEEANEEARMEELLQTNF